MFFYVLRHISVDRVSRYGLLCLTFVTELMSCLSIAVMSLEEEYQKIRDELQVSFDSGVTLPYEYRIGQLKKAAAMIKAMETVS